ncbi:MAG: hypothetical protein ACREOU_06070 [Candidatus Eiseniibacteriota bacterium]
MRAFARGVARAFGALALGALAVAIVPAPARAGVVHLSLFHPLSTNSDPNASAVLALSLVQSRIGALNGIGAHPVVSQVSDHAYGAQFAGVYSRVSGPVKGLTVSFFGLNSVGGSVDGAQLSGIVNLVESDMGGVQFAGTVNSVRGNLNGIQLATFVNLSGGRSGFLQVSTAGNISEGPFHGAQLSTFVNVGQQKVAGVQWGAGNIAGSLHGVQFGLLNFTTDNQGVQLGAVNISKPNGGVPIGLVNLSTETRAVEFAAFASTLSAVNVGVRTIVNGFQSTLTAGGLDLEGDVRESAFLTWNYGYRVPLGERFALGMDLGFAHIIPERTEDPDDHDDLHFAVLARALGEVRIGSRVGLLAGPGVARIYDAYSRSAGRETTLLLTGGLVVRP